MNASKSYQRNKTKKAQSHMYPRKRINCPICKYRIIDEGIETTSALHIMEDGDLWDGDYYTKCQRCNANIGIKKIE